MGGMSDVWVLQNIVNGNVMELLDEHDDSHACESSAMNCLARVLIVGVACAYQILVAYALVAWLRGATHKPEYSTDIMHWVTFEDYRLPTVRDDMVDIVCDQAEAIAALIDRISPRARAKLVEAQVMLA